MCPKEQQTSDNLIVKDNCFIIEIFYKVSFSGIPKGCLSHLTLSYPGGGGGVKYAPLLFFLHHPKTAQGIKLKLSDFKDTLLRHILQVKPVR